MDPRPPTRASAPAVWLTPYLGAWELAYGGKVKPEKISADLLPLHKQHGEECLRRWSIYLARNEGRYATAEKFAATFGQWDGTARANGQPPRRESKQEISRREIAAYVEQVERSQSEREVP